MIDLNNVTLFAFTGLDEKKHLSFTTTALKNSARGINFGAIKLFAPSNPEPFNDIELVKIDPCSSPDYSRFFVEELVDHIDTDYCIAIQWDGGIINPDKWRDEFFDYDYIGAPWPDVGRYVNRIGNGGFSFRSKKFLEVSAELTYDPRHHEYKCAPEDWFLCVKNYGYMIERGIKFPDVSLAASFSVEHILPERLFFRDIFSSYNTFGFHGEFNTGAMRALHETGTTSVVGRSSIPFTIDIEPPHGY